MSNDVVEATHYQTFESLKQEADGGEFWSARKLAKALEYSEYRHFLPVIERAKEACDNSRQSIADHFEDILEMVEIGSGARRQIEDVRLSRYACYLIVQNGDPAKTVVANGQTYFAIQTRRQELSDLDFAIFQNHGYQGLYGGLDAKDIHERKGLEKSQKILDHMGSIELAANLFRATQAEDKLRRENIQGKKQANETHFAVGEKVRQTIKELGGDMPENLPAAKRGVKQVEKEINKKLID